MNLVNSVVTFDDDALQNVNEDSRKYVLAAKVEKHIRASAGNNADILLYYPVVYLHTWINKRKEFCVYVGETIDLGRRTEEHEITGKSNQTETTPKWTWQNEWLEGTNKKSIYFSSTDFNKSLIEDIEDTLISVFEKNQNVNCKNGRDNKQKSYSNKNVRDGYTKEILKAFATEFNGYFNDTDGLLDLSDPRLDLTQGECSADIKTDGLIIYETVMPETADDLIQGMEKKGKNPDELKILTEWPVIYIHIWNDKNNVIHIYIGETIDIANRTKQHIDNIDGLEWREDWKKAQKKAMLVIGCKYFTRSLTLDLENRLIHYALYLDNLKVANGRTNEQRKYYGRDLLFGYFENIVKELNRKQPKIFVNLKTIREQAPLMASPFLTMTDEQTKAFTTIKNEIIASINNNNNSRKKKLLIVKGKAGTGKTVVLSHLLFDLAGTEVNEKKINTCFVVNHEELFKSYKAQEDALHITQDSQAKNIYQAQTLINEIANGRSVPDVIITDEGHLLYTKNTQGTHPEIQLKSLIDIAPILVLVFDEKQFVDDDKYFVLKNDNLEDTIRKLVGNKEDLDINILTLDEQLRMKCSKKTADWIDAISMEVEIPSLKESIQSKAKQIKDGYIIKDNNGYEIGVFETWEAMQERIRKRVNEKEGQIAKLLATYDFKYDKNAKSPYYMISKTSKESYKPLFWHQTGANNSTTDHIRDNIWTINKEINEVGSIYDIQGFDLDYAGVILGASVSFDDKNQKIQFIKNNRYAIPNNDKARELMANENHVLLTRGIKGLYIWARNTKLREALIKSIKEEY